MSSCIASHSITIRSRPWRCLRLGQRVVTASARDDQQERRRRVVTVFSRSMTNREIRSWLMDMDGVLVREEQAIPGAERFITRLRELGLRFLVLTNTSIYT